MRSMSPSWKQSLQWMRLKQRFGTVLARNHGPDGINFKFIKRYWDTIKLEFFNYIKHFETHGRLATGCNASFIVLIPKISDPLDLSDYRPISLIGCMYKVLSKLLSYRLSRVIHKLISPNQTAFLKGRQILDGSLIANEIVNFVKKKKIKMLLFKVDFEKAFDSVNWNFLLDTMSKMNFGTKWCNWISSCLSSCSMSVLVNGSASKEFKMECGLRQEDPLSPFLFLIVAEVLQVMIVDACNKGIFKGLSLADGGSNISILQYADDALFFGEWSEFSPLDDVASVARAINFSRDSLPFTYLGFPVGKSVKRVDAWNDVVLRLTKRLSPWKNNLLSIGGRLTLGFKENEKKIVWIRWQKIIADKKDGGLGFGSIKAKNLSLLGKWRWRFLNEKDALWRKIISKHYSSDEGFVVRRGFGQKSSTRGSIIRICSELNQFDISLSNLIVKKILSGRQNSLLE
ncbi:RNA-directed DNA polymerase, eukaryota, reverse transcriptase zinc-binding domain protein [Tanacetum coccineum]